MVSENSSDEQLLAEFLRGKIGPFNQLVDRYRIAILKFIYRQIHHAEDSKDICQNTFVQVFLKAHQYQGQAKFKTWLYQIALNLCRNLIRDQSRRPQSQTCESNDLISQEQPFDELAKQQQSEQLQQAIGNLPERQRITMELKIYEDMTYTEIADVLELSVGAVKANYHHAMNAVKKQFLGQKK